MTPKEKALELVESMKARSVKLSDYSTIEWPTAKLHAIFAVNEIIKSRQDDKSFDDTVFQMASRYATPHPMYLTYWKLVLEEIDNL